jgi:hypothetical protein
VLAPMGNLWQERRVDRHIRAAVLTNHTTNEACRTIHLSVQRGPAREPESTHIDGIVLLDRLGLVTPGASGASSDEICSAHAPQTCASSEEAESLHRCSSSSSG